MVLGCSETKFCRSLESTRRSEDVNIESGML